MRLLILGAGGFIGSNLVEYLHRSTRAPYEVVGVDINDEKVPELGGNFTFHRCDFLDPIVADEVERCDVVVDLVAYANPSIYVESPLETFELNFLQNLKIVDMCVKWRKRIIQYSTCEVYGRPSGPAYKEDETELICGPVNKQRWIYSAGKQLLERVIHAYAIEGCLDYSIIRPFNFIGPRFDYLVPAGNIGGPRVFAQFMSALLTGGPMYLVNGGEQRRSFTHIDDASAGFESILLDPRACNQIFNIGNPSNDTSIRELALLMIEVFSDLTGEAPATELIEIDGEKFYGPGYEDHTRVPADIAKLARLGWAPRHDLRSTLSSVMSWYLANRGSVMASLTS
jgi:nucleoside-diphosphate-sugar epimerase